MMRGMSAAISGLEASQTMLDVTANNLANVNTVGYKAQSTNFVDELSQTLTASTGPNAYNGGSNAQQVGLGTEVGSIQNNMTQGSQQSTGNPLDIAIQGDGFLVVGTSPGPTPPVADTPATAPPTYTNGLPNTNTDQYTRAGNLTLNSQGFLTTQSGQYVMGYTTASVAGTPSGIPNTYLNIPPGSTDVAVGVNGALSYTDETATDATYGHTVVAGYVGLASFPNEAGLVRDGGSLWSGSPSSGAAAMGTPSTGGFGQTIAGTLEGSNVDMATEFSNMITAQNSYEADAKVISTADQMLQAIVNMPQG